MSPFILSISLTVYETITEGNKLFSTSVLVGTGHKPVSLNSSRGNVGLALEKKH